MKILVWCIKVCILLAAEAVALLLTPLVVPFANRETGQLPKLFWWMDNPNAPIPGPKSITGGILAKRGWHAASVYWLWRNSVYALAGKFRVWFDFSQPVTFWHTGDKDAGVDPYHAGWFFGTMRQGNIWAWEFRAAWLWPMTKNKIGMFRVGYKLSKWFNGGRPELPSATGMLQVPSIRPFLSL